ncbi:MAG: hypothetical protein CL678_04615 [Bdellovibrionaceae bacterium]|nr:hypothetical protein [Pseudobdellovibrionaceae bacterium]|tara:strand:+ start:528 stop:968 length:441 start_codon:yes stop_codon:yes gene_type:complete
MSIYLLKSHGEWIHIAILIGRIFIGVCFMIHAFGKLGWVGPGGSMKGFAGWLKSLGVPMPKLQAYLAMLSELVGGAALALGLLMRPAAIVLFFTMVVAGLIGHKGGGYLITNNPPGAEYTINLAVILMVFFVIGPGRYSLDAILFL